ncbi:hypothetical protein EV702DRAFT_1198144 [Suillus placidus]|uniref:Uncharacterized protein n=1 Tax=Suillus placidus TaxID=48579 RepID=A0A9P7D189_9AGAM|nr:hypothetical protein EV702DRAFT_1198144 [Suillus placidus]
MNTCPGCTKKFEHTRYSHHLAKTTNPSCAALLQHASLFPELEDGDSDGLDGGGDDFFSCHLSEFTGEYFGYYNEQDLKRSNNNCDEPRTPLESDEEEEEDPDAELEHGWEQPADPVLQDVDEALLGRQPIVEKFPQHHTGAPVHLSRTTAFKSYKDVLQGAENVWAPFVSCIDYEVAKWAKLCGSGSTAFSELLTINGMSFLNWLHDALGLSYRNTHELNQIIDRQLLCRRPHFKHEEIIVADEAFDVYSRDIMECVKALYSDFKFLQHLNYAPEHHYVDIDKTI